MSAVVGDSRIDGHEEMLEIPEGYHGEEEMMHHQYGDEEHYMVEGEEEIMGDEEMMHVLCSLLGWRRRDGLTR